MQKIHVTTFYSYYKTLSLRERYMLALITDNKGYIPLTAAVLYTAQFHKPNRRWGISHRLT
jgi:hypothetical protein